MTEKALLFGESKTLVGVVTDPPPASNGGGPRGGVVFLNAGIVHRVGPNRLHVKLARELAEAGFVAMRFDFSGIGDSEPRRDGRPFIQSSLEEVKDALDYLASSRGIDRFVLVGLCSGADNALRVAARDRRVVGAVLIEGHAVPTTAYLRHLYRKKLLRPGSWLRLLSGRSELWQDVLRILKRSAAEKEKKMEGKGSDKMAGAEARPEEDSVSLVPSKSEIVSSLEAMGRRGTRALLVYSQGSPSHYFYQTTVRRPVGPLRRTGAVTTHLIRGTDHIFTHRGSQADLLTTVCEWTGSL